MASAFALHPISFALQLIRNIALAKDQQKEHGPARVK